MTTNLTLCSLNFVCIIVVRVETEARQKRYGSVILVHQGATHQTRDYMLLANVQ
jgi:hypothetical protein